MIDLFKPRRLSRLFAYNILDIKFGISFRVTAPKASFLSGSNPRQRSQVVLSPGKFGGTDTVVLLRMYFVQGPTGDRSQHNRNLI